MFFVTFKVYQAAYCTHSIIHFGLGQRHSLKTMKVFISSFVLSFIALSTNAAVSAVECPEGQDHEISFLPSPIDCSKYYVCVHSEPIEMECPAGLWFNNELNVCDFPDNVVCGGKSFKI